MILCDASRPGTSSGLYHRPYNESVSGHRHGYKTPHNGVMWTRGHDHPPDPRCPECAEEIATK